jgi:hypothetical protein
MTPYDHVLTLLSFVFALAITHLFSRLGGLLLARRRVRFSGLQGLMMVNAVTLVLANWLVTWASHGVKEWSLLEILSFFGVATGTYFLCASAAPEPAAEGPIDLDAFYWENRRLFWGVFTALTLVEIVSSIPFAQTAQVFFQGAFATLPSFAAPALAVGVSSRWAQWLSGLALLALNVVWMVVFTGSIS